MFTCSRATTRVKGGRHRPSFLNANDSRILRMRDSMILAQETCASETETLPHERFFGQWKHEKLPIAGFQRRMKIFS